MQTDIPALVEALIAPLGDFAARFGQWLPKTSGWRPRLTCGSCYLRLAEAEAAATALGPRIAAFAAETHVGLRVHHIHTAGLNLRACWPVWANFARRPSNWDWVLTGLPWPG